MMNVASSPAISEPPGAERGADGAACARVLRAIVVEERRITAQDNLAHVDQLGHPVPQDGRANHGAIIDLTVPRRVVVHDGQDLLDRDRNGARPTRDDDHEQFLPLRVSARGVRAHAEHLVQANQRNDGSAVLQDLTPADMLNDVTAHTLQPSDGRQRYRDPSSVSHADDEHPPGHPDRHWRRPAGLQLSFDTVIGQPLAGDALHVEDQADAAVAEQGGAGVDTDPAQAGREGLDDDLLGVQDAIQDQAEQPRVCLQDGDEGLALLARPLSVSRPEYVAQPDQREQHATPAQYRGEADVLDRGAGRLPVGRDELQHVDRRYRVELAGGLYDDRRDDRQCQREAQPPGRTATDRRLDLDRSADRPDLGLHDVQPDTAA